MTWVRVNCRHPLFASLWAAVGSEKRKEVEAFRKQLARKEAAHDRQWRRRAVGFNRNGIR
jgi:hypothetical protein